MTVTQAASGMFLRADDGASHIGDSGTFDVLAAALALSLPSNVNEWAGVPRVHLASTPFQPAMCWFRSHPVIQAG